MFSSKRIKEGILRTHFISWEIIRLRTRCFRRIVGALLLRVRVGERVILSRIVIIRMFRGLVFCSKSNNRIIKRDMERISLYLIFLAITRTLNITLVHQMSSYNKFNFSKIKAC